MDVFPYIGLTISIIGNVFALYWNYKSKLKEIEQINYIKMRFDVINGFYETYIKIAHDIEVMYTLTAMDGKKHSVEFDTLISPQIVKLNILFRKLKYLLNSDELKILNEIIENINSIKNNLLQISMNPILEYKEQIDKVNSANIILKMNYNKLDKLSDLIKSKYSL
ncbi:MAG: hypothetical protein M9949_05565 [Candidatus Kapabacteria bacterium]|nr:hypothetical protein [Candidatus Kapabacteria bacterium]